MQQVSPFGPSAESVRAQARSAEFPNDNPDLHLGAIWVNRDPCGPSEAEVRDIEDLLIETLTSEDAPHIDQTPTVLDAPVSESASESESESELDPEPLSVGRLEIPPPSESMVVMSRAPRDEVEAPVDQIVVEELDFDLSHVPLESGLPPEPGNDAPAAPSHEDGYATLVSTLMDVAVGLGGAAEAVKVLLDGEDAATAAAWARILRGESDDISTCGAAMLDEWAADVVARAVGPAGKASQIRRELRERGVCAFGLIEAA